MLQLHASAFVDHATFADIERAAAFYGMELQNFIDAALQAGLYHACKGAESADGCPDEHSDDLVRGGAADYVVDSMIEDDSDPPNPYKHHLEEDFAAVYALMRAPIRLRSIGESKGTVTVQLELNEEWVMFAGWQERRFNFQRERRADRCNLEGLAQSPEAISYLRTLIEGDFQQSLDEMREGFHSLYRERPDSVGLDDDDIPF